MELASLLIDRCKRETDQLRYQPQVSSRVRLVGLRD